MLQIFNYLDSCDNALLHTVHSECTILVIHTCSDCHIFVLISRIRIIQIKPYPHLSSFSNL